MNYSAELQTELREEIKSLGEQVAEIRLNWKDWSPGDLIAMLRQLQDSCIDLIEYVEGEVPEENL